MEEKTDNIDILEEKEKRALENVKSLLLYSSEHEYFSPFKEEEIDDMNIVLNLVSNLIAENKELKEENEGLKTKLDTLIEKYKELKEEIENWKFTKEYVEKNYIDKSKVEGLIEELDIEIQCCTYADDDVEEYKQDIEKEKARLLRDKKMLQSLLGKE